MDSMDNGGIKWGDPIELEGGKRPAWLKDDETIQWIGRGVDWSFWEDRDTVTADVLDRDRHTTHIRLPADHPHYQKQAAQAATPAIDPALVERMVYLVRLMADDDSALLAGEYRQQARDIIKALEPDSDLLEAREIAKPWLIYDGAYSIDNGYCDDQPAMKAVLAAIRRGRQLERDRAQAEALS